MQSLIKNIGLTVIEVLIGLTVIVIIVLVSIPGVDLLSQKYHQKKASANLISSLTLAQTEAARRRSIVSLCPTSDGDKCRDDGDWNRGWVLFEDRNANSKPDSMEIIESFESPGSDIRIHAYGAFSDQVSFDTLGDLIANDRSNAGGFMVCYADGGSGYLEVQVNAEGITEPKIVDETCEKEG